MRDPRSDEEIRERLFVARLAEERSNRAWFVASIILIVIVTIAVVMGGR